MSISSHRQPVQVKPARRKQAHSAYQPSARPYIPAGAEEKPAGKSLGTSLGTYYARPISKGEKFILTLLLVLAVLLPLSYGIWLGYYAYTKYGPASVPAWSYPWLLTTACGFLLWFLILTLRRKDSRRMVVIERNGLCIVARNPFHSHPRTLRSMSWDQISGITIEVATRTSPDGNGNGIVPVVRFARINLSQGRPLRLCQVDRPFGGLLEYQSLQNLGELVTRLKASYYPHVFPKLKASYLGGEWLKFGPLSLHRQYLQFKSGGLFRGGLFRDRHPIPWNQVQHITIRSGDMVIELIDQGRPGKAKRIPIGCIPNLELLLRLIDNYTN